MQDLYSAGPTQGTCTRSYRLYGCHPAHELQVRHISALKDLDHRVGVDNLYGLSGMYVLISCEMFFAVEEKLTPNSGCLASYWGRYVAMTDGVKENLFVR